MREDRGLGTHDQEKRRGVGEKEQQVGVLKGRELGKREKRRESPNM